MSDPFAPPSPAPDSRPNDQPTEKVGYEPSTTYPPATSGGYPPAPAPAAPQSPYGTGPAGVYPGAPAQPTDSRGWVIAGFLTFWPLGIAALFPSLRASRAIGAGDLPTASREAASAKKLGIIAIIVAVVMAVLYIVGWVVLAGILAANVRGGFEDLPTGSESSLEELLDETTDDTLGEGSTQDLPEGATETATDDLAVGQCYLTETYAESMDAVVVVPCDVSHGGEVYAQLPIAQDTYPTSDEAYVAGDELCEPAFEEFLGISYLDSDLYYKWYLPTEGAWDAGNHSMTCAIDTLEGDLVTGTLEGAAY